PRHRRKTSRKSRLSPGKPTITRHNMLLNRHKHHERATGVSFMTGKPSVVSEQFESLEQQQDASNLGMWVFLATEVMFFGALFLGYTVYRSLYAEAFAEASRHLNVLLGSINTGVLLCSSLSMALAVQAAQIGRQGRVVGFLLGTMALGIIFLGIKGF